jgi:hypothetical protein
MQFSNPSVWVNARAVGRKHALNKYKMRAKCESAPRLGRKGTLAGKSAHSTKKFRIKKYFAITAQWDQKLRRWRPRESLISNGRY